ncbi:MAG: ECF transporter S component [Candidatus Izemoplasmatales bacterium]|jgi:riboflavin transporter FmnP|nr:ECF transporter S component [Candidatus Izemoplasmatales bacterium]
MKNRTNIRKLLIIALLSTISIVLMLFDFPLFFAPNFYELDFSEIPVLVGAFAYGPLTGVIIEAVKILLNLMFTGSITMGVGELANFLIGISLIVPASVIYYRHKTKKRALIGLVVGTFTMVTIGALLNAFVLLPAYAFFLSTPQYTLTIADFVAAGAAVNPLVNNVFSLIMFAVVPFNLLKGILVSVVVLLIYKRVSMLIKAKDSEDFEETN